MFDFELSPFWLRTDDMHVRWSHITKQLKFTWNIHDTKLNSGSSAHKFNSLQHNHILLIIYKELDKVEIIQSINKQSKATPISQNGWQSRSTFLNPRTTKICNIMSLKSLNFEICFPQILVYETTWKLMLLHTWGHIQTYLVLWMNDSQCWSKRLSQINILFGPIRIRLFPESSDF